VPIVTYLAMQSRDQDMQDLDVVTEAVAPPVGARSADEAPVDAMPVEVLSAAVATAGETGSMLPACQAGSVLAPVPAERR
jgi:hypothetical protein